MSRDLDFWGDVRRGTGDALWVLVFVVLTLVALGGLALVVLGVAR